MNISPATVFSEKDYFVLLESQSVFTLFHPIVSVKRRKLLGFEALSRGRDEGGNTVPPGVMFEMAERTGTVLELDRLCRRKSLENFQGIHSRNRDLVLSLNIDSSVLNSSGGSNHLHDTVMEFKIDPSSIIIEILESSVRDLNVLQDFVKRYKSKGFLIAMDDIGSGFSNLERVILLQPDVIKIDRSLITGIASDFYRQEVVKSIISMAHGVGSVIISEGVETESDVMTCLEFGSDFIQGFYFSKPGSAELLEESLKFKIESTAEKFKSSMLSRVNERHVKFTQYDFIIENLADKLSCLDPADFEDFLVNEVTDFSNMECAYVIDDDGIQITRTVFRDPEICGRRIFRPDLPGTNQSFKDYFFYLKTGLSKYTSPEYVSGASGRLCTTISTVFTDRNKSSFVLCCDMLEE